MQKKKNAVYNPELELAKGATLDAAAYDKTQKIKVTAAKVTVGGIPGRVEISGTATGRQDASINGCLGIWFSIFRYMRPNGTTDHVAGWNIMIPLAAGQLPAATAEAFAACINAGTRPYRAAAEGGRNAATIKIIFIVK